MGSTQLNINRVRSLDTFLNSRNRVQRAHFIPICRCGKKILKKYIYKKLFIFVQTHVWIKILRNNIRLRQQVTCDRYKNNNIYLSLLIQNKYLCGILVCIPAL